MPLQASAPQPTHASAETASASTVIRRVARTLRRQRSAGGASPSCATRRSTTRLRIPTAATAATSVNASRPTPGPEVPVEEPVDDRGDGRVAGRGAAVGVEHGGGRGVALHRAHRELGPQRPPHRERAQVERGVADLHQPGRARPG